MLAALSAGPAHGYAVIEEIKRRSGQKFNLPEGTVYPALHRLEEAGLLTRQDAGATLTPQGLLEIDRHLPTFFEPRHRGSRYT